MLTIAIFILTFLLSPNTTYAQATWNWQTDNAGRCVAPTTMANAQDVATIQGFECLFYNILQIIFYAAGIAFFVVFIINGFKYLLSAGDAKKTAAISSSLGMAALGLVGVIISWFIILIIQDVTGINITTFTIPGGTP